MDTDEKYRDGGWFVVHMANGIGHPPPHHVMNHDVPIDGQIEFRYPKTEEDLEENRGGRNDYWIAASFPFRDHRKNNDPWAAFPEKPNFEQHPVWKWQNPEDARRDDDSNLEYDEEVVEETITLSPSIGLGQPMYFHCHVREGEIDWL